MKATRVICSISWRIQPSRCDVWRSCMDVTWEKRIRSIRIERRENVEFSIECVTSSIQNTCSTEPHSGRESQEQVGSDGLARNVTSHRRTEWWVVDVGSWWTSPMWPSLDSRLQDTRLKNARQDNCLAFTTYLFQNTDAKRTRWWREEDQRSQFVKACDSSDVKSNIQLFPGALRRKICARRGSTLTCMTLESRRTQINGDCCTRMRVSVQASFR